LQFSVFFNVLTPEDVIKGNSEVTLAKLSPTKCPCPSNETQWNVTLPLWHLKWRAPSLNLLSLFEVPLEISSSPRDLW